MENHTHYKMQLSKVNEVYLKLEVDPSLSKELANYFTFEVPGARFMPKYRNRIWDGKIRLFSEQTGKIYVGLLPYIKQYCEKNNISINIDKGVEDDRDIVRKSVRDFIISLRPKSKGKELEIRDYQIDAVYHALRNHLCLILSPTASGKSLIIYLLSRWYESNRVLILVPTTSLVEQMYSDFLDYGYVESKMQKIYQGHSREITKEITISTWQSLYKMPRKYFEQFGCILGDEVHQFKAKSLTNIMNKMHQTQYRHGFTGTLDGMQTHRLVLEGLFGSVNKVTSTKELMEKKTLAKLNIKCIVLQYPDADKKFMKGKDYQEEVDLIVRDERRNKFIVNLTKHLKGNTLVLFQFVEKHGSVLHDMFINSVESERKVFYIWGGTDTLTREHIREITETQDNAIIVASYGTFSTGINIRNLHNVVFSSPSKSRIRVLQSIGRGLRTNKNKDGATLLDIADDFTWKSKPNFTLRHFMERINIYNEEEFDYEIKNLPIES